MIHLFYNYALCSIAWLRRKLLRTTQVRGAANPKEKNEGEYYPQYLEEISGSYHSHLKSGRRA
jgi:hypothetical protein